jgi:hypothetical protein
VRTLWKSLGGKRQADNISAGVGAPAQTIEQPQGMKNRRINPHADGVIAAFNTAKRRATRECAFGNHSGRQSAPLPCVADVGPELVERSAYSQRRAVRRGHDGHFVCR